MTHVCFVGYGIHQPWNEGRKVISKNIIDALKQHTDLDVSVVSSVGKGEEKRKGVEYANATWLTRHTKGYDPLLDAAMIRLISSINRRKKIDIIHLFNAHFPVFSFYGKRVGKPVVAQFFGNPHLNILKRLRVPKAIDMYITTSIENRWFADLGITNFQNVNPPINTDLFKPEDKSEARKYFKLPADKFILLYMGNLSEVRFSPDFISETNFLGNPNNLLVIAANLIDSYWQNNSLLHKENIILRRQILTDMEKAMLYNAADAFILPFDTKLKSYRHVFVIDPPITMLEAMSCGVPVIAPEVFSIPKIIRDGYNGYVTPLGDFEGVNMLLHDLSEEQEVEEAGINARKTILNEFSYEKIAFKMKEVYEGVLNNG
jgi:glycosyltransferase involved in cell wall biosynthesis